jgi:hypothetical protein
MTDVRGAIGFCRAEFLREAKGKTGAPLKYREPQDATLTSMLEEQQFLKMLTEASALNKIRQADVIKCLGGLYHTAPKEHHRRSKTDQMSIHLDGWESNEIICLEVLFRMNDMPFVHLNPLSTPM